MYSPQASTSDTEAGTFPSLQPEWFERVYCESRGRIYNLCARILGDRDEAADLTQEVFLRALTHQPDARAQQNPDPWLYRIAVNACYDHLRRRSARATTPLEHAGEIPSATDDFASSETRHAVEAALAMISPRYRTALVLKDLHGLGTSEIADAMGVSRTNARVVLHRARSAFRRAFRGVAPAGSGVASALGLAAFLPELPLPASLQVLPVASALVPAAPLALAPVPPLAGVLAKVGGGLGVKGAIVVIAAAAVTTGGMTARHLAGGDGLRADGGPAPAVAEVGQGTALHDPGETRLPLRQHAERRAYARDGGSGPKAAGSGGSKESNMGSGEGTQTRSRQDGASRDAKAGSEPDRVAARLADAAGMNGSRQAATASGAPAEGAPAGEAGDGAKQVAAAGDKGGGGH